MAELKGPILFSGSIGGIRAYYDKVLKKYFISTKGGSTKELIKNNPKMVRQRENMNEFKACSKWASQLRSSLNGILHLCAGYYFSDIVALAKVIQKQDNLGLKGIRSIESSKFSRLLTGLNLNKIHPFDRIFAHQYQILFSEDKKTVTLMLSGFRSLLSINWPERFLAYRITLVIAEQSDWEWNARDEQFQPVVSKLGFTAKETFSEWRKLSREPEDIMLTASFLQPALQHPGTTVVVAIGIEVSGYLLDASMVNMTGTGTMKIVECFV